MKIALIADIHHGPHSHVKKEGWDGLPELEAFVRHAEAERADLLLDLGDRISDTTYDTDVIVAGEVYDRLSAFSGERRHILGNHDVGNLTRDDNARILNQTFANQVVDLGDIRLIMWQPNVKIDFQPGAEIGFPPSLPDLPWLVDALNADERPAIIASHVPLSGHSQAGNFYFENNPQVSTYPDYLAVRTAVEQTGRAVLWLSGHVHWNTVTNVRNVQHITLQSFSERFTTYPEPACAYGFLEIKGDSYTLDVHGRDPFHVRLPFRPSGAQKWMAPMPSFTQMRERPANVQDLLDAQVAEHA